MKLLRTFVALGLLAIGMSASAATTWIMASGYPEDNFLTQNIRTFIDEVDKESKGRLKIDLRSSDTLIKLDAVKRAVQVGQVPIGEIRMGVYGNEGPMYILDSLPNIAKDYNEAMLLTEAQKPFFNSLFAKNGMRIITYVAWPGQGFYTKGPVSIPADFKGKKLRIYSPATQKMGELLGFQPVTLPFSEITQAFASGLIESLFTSAQTGTDTQAWENTKYFTYTGTMHNKNAIIVSERAFRALEGDLQKILLEAGERATQRGWELSKKANKEKLDTLRSHGMAVTDASPAIQDAMQKVGETMMEDWRKAASPEERQVLDAYVKARAAQATVGKSK